MQIYVRKNVFLSHNLKSLPSSEQTNKKKHRSWKLNCVVQGESGWTGPEQQPSSLCPKLTWKSTLCPRFEAITPGVRFKTFVCQHDSREQGCNLMRGQREWETQHGPGSSGRSSICYWLKSRGFICTFVSVPSSLRAWVSLTKSCGLKFMVNQSHELSNARSRGTLQKGGEQE